MVIERCVLSLSIHEHGVEMDLIGDVVGIVVELGEERVVLFLQVFFLSLEFLEFHLVFHELLFKGLLLFDQNVLP